MPKLSDNRGHAESKVELVHYGRYFLYNHPWLTPGVDQYESVELESCRKSLSHGYSASQKFSNQAMVCTFQGIQKHNKVEILQVF